MRRLLSNPNKEIKQRKKESKSSKKSSLTEESQNFNASNIEISEKKETPQSEYIPVVPTISDSSERKHDSKNITKKDCEKILELLRTPTFNQMISILTVKESIIISLKLGYVDGKYFSTDSIAQFLGIDAQEVIDIVKKVLLLYKENINQFIDNAIEIVTEQPKQLTRKQ